MTRLVELHRAAVRAAVSLLVTGRDCPVGYVAAVMPDATSELELRLDGLDSVEAVGSYALEAKSAVWVGTPEPVKVLAYHLANRAEEMISEVLTDGAYH